MNTHYQLTPEAEFRYVVTWFRDFSEYEKADFMTILIQWLLKNSEICVNGINDDTSMASESGKPLSIFLCRVSCARSYFHTSKIKFHNRNFSFEGQAVQRVDNEVAESAAFSVN